MKNAARLGALLLTATLLLTGCKLGEERKPTMGFITVEDFSGYSVGIVRDKTDVETVKERIGKPKIKTFNTVKEGLSALLDKKISGIVLPAVYANEAVKSSKNFNKLLENFDLKELRGISMSSSKFIMPIDAAITLINGNGTLDKIIAKYYPDALVADAYTAPESEQLVSGRELIIGVSSENNFPLNYRDATGEIIGVNIDVAREIAAECGAKLIVKEYAESKLEEALKNGDVDFIMSAFTEPEKPADKLIYSASYFDASSYILIRSPLADLDENNKKSD